MKSLLRKRPFCTSLLHQRLSDKVITSEVKNQEGMLRYAINEQADVQQEGSLVAKRNWPTASKAPLHLRESGDLQIVDWKRSAEI
jgi:hypothetical protein